MRFAQSSAAPARIEFAYMTDAEFLAIRDRLAEHFRIAMVLDIAGVEKKLRQALDGKVRYTAGLVCGTAHRRSLGKRKTLCTRGATTGDNHERRQHRIA